MQHVRPEMLNVHFLRVSKTFAIKHDDAFGVFVVKLNQRCTVQINLLRGGEKANINRNIIQCKLAFYIRQYARARCKYKATSSF